MKYISRQLEEIEDSLQRIPFFRGLTPDLVSAIAAKLHCVRYKHDEVVIDEGSVGNSLYVIESGRVKISTGSGPDERIINYMGPGDLFGELALLLNQRRIASVTAVSDADLWELRKADLYEVVKDYPSLVVHLNREFSPRLTWGLSQQPVQITPLFISYSHTDSAFVDHMERRLEEKGIGVWRDVHHATAGRLEKVVDRAIRHNPTVLLILSANSVKSDWVQHEVRLARKLEIETERDVLCPVALDDSWKTCRWPERLREQIEEYHIMDFSEWEDAAHFERMFIRLIDGLDLFYKG